MYFKLFWISYLCSSKTYNLPASLGERDREGKMEREREYVQNPLELPKIRSFWASFFAKKITFNNSQSAI